MKNKYGFDIKRRAKILQDFADSVSTLKTRFFLSHGTLLGAYRDGILMPHDNDIDIDACEEEVQAEWHQLVKCWRACGFTARINGPILSLRGKGEIVGIRQLHLAGDQRLYRKLAYPARFWEKRVTIEFLDRRWYVPAPIEEYLEFVYRDWKTPTKRNGFSSQFKRQFYSEARRKIRAM